MLMHGRSRLIVARPLGWLLAFLAFCLAAPLALFALRFLPFPSRLAFFVRLRRRHLGSGAAACRLPAPVNVKLDGVASFGALAGVEHAPPSHSTGAAAAAGTHHRYAHHKYRPPYPSSWAPAASSYRRTRHDLHRRYPIPTECSDTHHGRT